MTAGRRHLTGRGDTARDVTVLAIPINVPAGANCLSFDFRFLSEEYPDFIDSRSSTTPSSPSSTPRRGSRRAPMIGGLENDFALDATGAP